MAEYTLWQMILPLISALRWTVSLTLLAFIFGGAVGVFLLVLRSSKQFFLVKFVQIYIQIFQGTPLVIQMFIFYFGLSFLGIQAPEMVVAALCLTFYASAFLVDVWYSCVNAIPKGQWEASGSLALSFVQQLRFVIFPQAFRLSVAPTVSILVQVIKGTALASIIGFIEITKVGQMIANATYQPFVAYGLVAILYFSLCFPLSLLSRRLEIKSSGIAK